MHVFTQVIGLFTCLYDKMKIIAGAEDIVYSMKWNGMEWNGLDWIGLDWNGREWSGKKWIVMK